MIPLKIEGVEFALSMKALASLESSFKVSGMDKVLETVTSGGHTKMVVALSAMSGKGVEYFGEWSMMEVQDVFTKSLNLSMFGSEVAPADPLDSKK
jgi:hypothetical protein